MFRCAALAFALAVALVPAQAQTHRNFPATALRGELLITAPPEATLNGQPVRLAPGSRIRGEDNMLQMSGALAGRKLVVHYTREANGLLFDVWVLNPAELANRNWPKSEAEAQALVFDPVGQIWSKP
jgi:hypothetical protein